MYLQVSRESGAVYQWCKCATNTLAGWGKMGTDATTLLSYVVSISSPTAAIVQLWRQPASRTVTSETGKCSGDGSILSSTDEKCVYTLNSTK